MEKSEVIKNILSSATKYSSWMKNAEERYNSRSWIAKSQDIAIKVMAYLKENSLSQVDFAERLGVSPQYVNKIVKGKENLTLETIDKLERVLNIRLMVTDQLIVQTKSTFSNVPEYAKKIKRTRRLKYGVLECVYNSTKGLTKNYKQAS